MNCFGIFSAQVLLLRLLLELFLFSVKLMASMLWDVRFNSSFLWFTSAPLVSSVGRAPVCSAGGRRFELQTGPALRVLK